MKRKLLLLTALVVSALTGMRAQQTPQADGTVYYLYNTSSNTFLSRGHAWGTQAAMDDHGLAFKLVSSDVPEAYYLQFLDGGYLSDDGFLYTDGGDDRRRAMKFILSDAEKKEYKVQNTNNSKFVENWYGNAVGDANENRLNYLWQFYSEEERNNKIQVGQTYNLSHVIRDASLSGVTTTDFVNFINSNYAAKDKTSLIKTATFAGGKGDWSYVRAGDNSGDPAYGQGYCEMYERAGTLSQTISDLTPGIYKVTVQGFERPMFPDASKTLATNGMEVKTAYLQANNEKIWLKTWYEEKGDGNDPDNIDQAKAKFSSGKYLNELFVYVGEEGKIDLKFVVPSKVNGHWVIFNNFTLTYYDNAVSDEDKTAILQTVTELENDPMNKDVRQNLTNAKSTFDSTSTIQNYNALGAAIQEANTSINAYKNANAVLEAILAEAENTNIYTAESFAVQYTANKNKYDDRSMTDAEASAMRVGDHYAGNLPPVLLSAWKKGETPAINNSGFYINTWSGEGNNDGSNFKTPFYEYWVGDNDVLAATTLTAVQTGLEPNQTYKVSIWARVRQTNNATKATSGITMKVGDGNAIDISAGTQIGTSQLYIGEYAAVGKTDADGNLTVTITVNEESNISWLAFKNVKFEESTGVVPTELTLSDTEVTLNLGETKKVTATILPEDAEVKTVIWTSSDGNVATVANGEIMAVGEGTATITAKAEGNESLTKAVAVTVNAIEAPEFFTTELVDNTDYYIYNAALGKFLGGANSWGTQASMIEHGIPFTLAIADGKYTLDSHTYNNQNDHFFNGVFVDQPSTPLYITAISDGKFSISTGENSNYVSAKAGSTVVDNTATSNSDQLAQWYFVSKNDRDKMLMNASDDNPVDATYYIKEANISRNLRVSYGVNGWKGISYGDDKNQEISNYNAQVWNAQANVSQEITDIPNGNYTLRMQGFTTEENQVTLKANESSISVQKNKDGINKQSVAATYFADKKYTNELNVSVTNHKLTISLIGDCSSGKWLCYDNFELYLKNYTPVTSIVSASAETVEAGAKTDISVTTDPEVVTFGFDYESLNEEIATVDENGVITGVAEGTATIKVTAKMQSDVNKTFEVTVTAAPSEEDYVALASAIEDAESKVMGFDKDDYAPYNNIDAIARLKAAKAIEPEGTNSKSFVQETTQALIDAPWKINTAEMNAVFDGTFATAENNGAPNGWTMSNNTLGGSYHSRAFVGDARLSEFNETNSGLFARFDGTNSDRGSMYYYGNTENYTMPLKANTVYYVKVDFTNWGTTNNRPLRLNVTGPEGFEGTGSTVNSKKDADKGSETPDQIMIVFKTASEGNYVINFQCPGGDDNKHNVVISNVELFRASSVSMSVKAGKYGTFIAPFNVAIPEGVKAYKVNEMEADGKTVKLEEVTATIPANTPVVLENTTEENFTKDFFGKSTATENTYTVGLLTGVYNNSAEKPYVIPASTETTVNYVLQTQPAGQAFYKVESDYNMKTPNRAYLTVEGSSNVKAIFFPGQGDATGINAVSTLLGGDVEGIYTVGGAKVNNLQKGVNIIRTADGKTTKVLVK